MIDITLEITPKMISDAQTNNKKSLAGHLGTHFDAMNKEFPLDYAIRKGIIFDVSGVKNRDIDIPDIDISKVQKNMFVAFYSGFVESVGYGSKTYFTEHPQLSDGLIQELLDGDISIIGVDFAGIRRGTEHTPKDQYCADKGVFIIENLCNLKEVLALSQQFTAYTFPMRYAETTGLPCRVLVEI